MPKKKKASKEFAHAQNRILSLRVPAFPKDAISGNYISAGWILSQMDVAGGIRGDDYVHGRVVTVAVDDMDFHKPVYMGDVVSIYTEVIKEGRTSLAIRVESWSQRRGSKEIQKVTEGTFIFVAIDENHNPRVINSVDDKSAEKPKKQKLKVKSELETSQEKPQGDLTQSIVTAQDNTNYQGDIFGGWLLEQMDLAGLQAAKNYSGARVATVAVDAMTFHEPVHVGDQLSFYAQVVRQGNTSVTIKVEAWADDGQGADAKKVTEGNLTYVSIDKKYKPVPIEPRKP